MLTPVAETAAAMEETERVTDEGKTWFMFFVAPLIITIFGRRLGVVLNKL